MTPFELALNGEPLPADCSDLVFTSMPAEWLQYHIAKTIEVRRAKAPIIQPHLTNQTTTRPDRLVRDANVIALQIMWQLIPEKCSAHLAMIQFL